MNLREDCMEIHADLIDVCGAQYVSYHTMCRWIEKFRAGKVSFEDGHHLGPPVSDKKEQTMLFVKKIIEEDPHITFMKYLKDATLQLTQLKEMCTMVLTWEKSWQDGHFIS